MTGITADLSVKGILRRITVLFIFLLNCEVTVVSTGMAAITKAFPDASPILINLVYTFPILISVFMNFFVVPPLAKRYDKKNLVMFALVLYIIGGLGGVLATGTIFQIIGMRALVGIGAGIAAPLCGAIINDLYDGRDKENMLGWANGVDSLMAIILVMIAGYLCAIKWNYLFWIYSYFIIVFFMVAAYMPSIPAPAAESVEKKKVKLSYNGKQKFKLFLICLYEVAFTIFLVVVMMKMSIFIELDAKLGDAIVSSRAISITTAGILIGSMIFGFADKLFRRYTMIVSTVCVGAGAYIMFGAHALTPVFIGCFIVGFGAGLNLPVVQSRALAIGIKGDGTFANAMVIGIMNGGQFLATFVEKGVALFAEPTARNLIGSVSYTMIAITVITLIYIIVDPLKGVNADSNEAVPANS